LEVTGYKPEPTERCSKLHNLKNGDLRPLPTPNQKLAKVCTFEQAAVGEFQQNIATDANRYIFVVRGLGNTEFFLPPPCQDRCEAGPRAFKAVDEVSQRRQTLYDEAPMSADAFLRAK